MNSTRERLSSDTNGKDDSVMGLVLNWKDSARTHKCVSTLLKEKAIKHVLIVDNESESNSKPLLENFSPGQRKNISVIALTENRGFAAGINPGLHAFIDSNYSHVLVINNDAYVTAESVDKLLDTSRQLSTVPHLVGPKILYPNGEIQANGSKINKFSMSVNHNCWPAQPDYLTWACVLTNKETIQKIGFLDERFFMYWEDANYGQRIISQQGALVIIEDAIVIHEESATKEIIGPKTVQLASASLGTFSVVNPMLFIPSLVRLLVRSILQGIQHGAKTGFKNVAAFVWGCSQPNPAWSTIEKQWWWKS
jgi:N-acetylglucosaminyl-diphospho-decaprenol L-rhamnosyltransferase